VHPPVEVERFTPGAPGDYFLLVTELVKHKLVEVALEAAKRVERPIKVVGGGPELDRLQPAYSGTAEFLGRVPDHELAQLYANALAYVMPNAEEFGISAVEAQAAGRPVLAADAGGARETVQPGRTGVLVPIGDVDALSAAMRDTDFLRFDPEVIRRNAERFSPFAFKERFLEQVADAVRG
jgi:glycosyltransferase involved in cell wall biosynthesis